MRQIFVKIFAPSFFGTIAVVAALELDEKINPAKNDSWSFNSLTPYLYFSMLILALILQTVLIIPIVSRRIKKKKFTSLFYLIMALSLIFGTIGGFCLWEKDFGIKDIIQSLAIVISLNLLYWTINILTLNKIEKINGY
jgi:hypothetical protein